jgi:hypothetical protein
MAFSQLGFNDADVIRSGQAIVPDYAADLQAKLLNRLREAQVAATQQTSQIEASKFGSEQRQQASYLNAVADLAANPSYEGFRAIQLQFPEQHQAISAAFSGFDDNQRQRTMGTLAEVVALGRNGRWDLAANGVEKLVDAESNAGFADETDYEMLRILREGDDDERQAALGLLISQMAAAGGPKFMAENWNAFFDEDRDRSRLPSQLRKEAADADVAEAEAENAGDFFEGRAREQLADAGIAESNSAWAEMKNATTVAKSSAQLGNIRSMIAKRAAALGKPIEKVTVGEVRSYIGKKRSKGGLSPTEQIVEGALSPKPAPPRSRRTAPAAPIIVNPKTGQRMTLRDGKWVPLR